MRALLEVDLPHTLPVAKRVDLEQKVVHLDSAGAAASAVADGRNHVVARVDQLLVARLELLPVAVPALPHAPHGGRTAGRQLLLDLPDDVGSEVGGRGGV